jgi:hypothetical protein
MAEWIWRFFCAFQEGGERSNYFNGCSCPTRPKYPEIANIARRVWSIFLKKSYEKMDVGSARPSSHIFFLSKHVLSACKRTRTRTHFLLIAVSIPGGVNFFRVGLFFIVCTRTLFRSIHPPFPKIVDKHSLRYFSFVCHCPFRRKDKIWWSLWIRSS